MRGHTTAHLYRAHVTPSSTTSQQYLLQAQPFQRVVDQTVSTTHSTAHKCAVFGICCEGIPRQVTYLIDEASDVGKGANTVISFLHHFFQHHSLGEVDVGLHTDNCVGQNKNNAVLQVRSYTYIYRYTLCC